MSRHRKNVCSCSLKGRDIAINKVIKYAKVLLAKTNNLIKRRIILFFYRKYAGLLEDLKSMKQFEKYFIAKEDAKKHIEELKSRNEPIRPEDGDWYEPTLDILEIYVYQDLPLGVTNILYGKCCISEFVRRGYDDPICLAGVYPVDNDGNINGLLMGYKFVDGDIDDGLKNVCDFGIRGHGKLYITCQDVMYNFEKLKQYAMEQINNKNNQLQDIKNS